MDDNTAIEFNGVSESFDIDMMIDGKTSSEKFTALRDVNVAISRGECVAVIGPNGAGKSTFLRLIAGLMKPDRGVVRVTGRVGSLLDLGAGFHPELTGRDNLYLNASLYNLGSDMIVSRFEEIVKFAGIGRFIDAPLKCYSQGMYVRIAFSLAINVDPDILLIDDCLAVGDEEFQMKCIDKVLELKEKGTTIVFVTHDLNLAQQVCSRGIYIRNGMIAVDAGIRAAAAAYSKPIEIDVRMFKYLGLKKQEDARSRREEERRRQEEERRRQEEERRKAQAEAEKRAEDFKKRDEEWQRMIQEESRRLETQWQKRDAEWLRQRREEADRQKERKKKEAWKRRIENGKVSLAFDAGAIRLYYAGVEMTAASGIFTAFYITSQEYVSQGAFTRVAKLSDHEWVCCLKWPKPLLVSQFWKVRIQDGGVIDMEIIMQERGIRTARNEHIDLRLSARYSPDGIDAARNKATVLHVRGEPGLSFAALEGHCISGCYTNAAGGPTPYFVKVAQGAPVRASAKKSRHTCFKGRIRIGGTDRNRSRVQPAVYAVGNRMLEARFQDGRIDLSSSGAALTECLGMYSSVHSRGVWYDSTQAFWDVKEAVPGQVVAEGFWPWIPVSQVWKLVFGKDGRLFWEILMRVHEDAALDIIETACMLSPAYTQWAAGGDGATFPQEFTADDVFRYCVWSHAADGALPVEMISPSLPVLSFETEALEQYKLVLENSAHIYGTRSRLLHCMTINKDIHARAVHPGTYTVFRGHVTIKGDAK